VNILVRFVVFCQLPLPTPHVTVGETSWPFRMAILNPPVVLVMYSRSPVLCGIRRTSDVSVYPLSPKGRATGDARPSYIGRDGFAERYLDPFQCG